MKVQKNGEVIIIEMDIDEATVICEEMPQMALDMVKEFADLYDALDKVLHK